MKAGSTEKKQGKSVAAKKPAPPPAPARKAAKQPAKVTPPKKQVAAAEKSAPTKAAKASSAAAAPKKKVASAATKSHVKEPKKAKVTDSTSPAKTRNTSPAAKPDTKHPQKKVSPAPKRNQPKKADNRIMSKPKKSPSTAAAEPAKAPVAERKSSKTKTADTKSRSAHLKKLIALREERKKISTRGKSDGLSSSVVTPGRKSAKPAAAPQAAVAPAPPVPQPMDAEKRKRVRRKAPYSKGELKELRAMLVEERESLIRDLRQLDEIAESGRQTTHATFSSHQADAASDSAALESTFIQRRYEEERFAAVSEALVRLEEGTYGLCDFCAEEQNMECATCPFIPVDRLRAKPFARMCVQLRTKMEKRNRR